MDRPRPPCAMMHAETSIAAQAVGAMERIWLRQYEPGVPATLSYPEAPLFGMLEERVGRFPRHPAVILAGPGFSSTLTYRRVNELANRFANALIALGVKPGDRVALRLPNLPQFVVCFYGALKAGAVVVPVNPLYTPRELTAVLRGVGTRVLVTLPQLLPGELSAAETGVEVTILTEADEHFPLLWRLAARIRARRARRPAGALSLRGLLARAGGAPPGVSVPPDALAVLQYTGGTTGTPKAAMLTHRNLLANAVQMSRWLTDLREGEERFLAAVPFFHVYGLTVGVNTAVVMGGAVICVLMPLFDARRLAGAIARYRPTIFPGAPSMYLAINQLKDIRRDTLSSIKVCVCGSASLPREVQTQFERLSGATVVEGYGLTEASPGTHVNPVHGVRKLGSIGLPLPDTDARIVDLDTGERDVPPGEEGELLIRGPQVMAGYWNAPEETAAALRGGWLHTGDVARVDADGFFYIVDRKKDLVNVGGLKVYPREIEEVLHAHPKVKEAAAAGVPHRVRGEQLVAYVVLKDGGAGDAAEVRRELLEFCRARLAPYKVPRRIRIMDTLPKTSIGKPLRREIRAAEAARPDDTGA